MEFVYALFPHQLMRAFSAFLLCISPFVFAPQINVSLFLSLSLSLSFLSFSLSFSLSLSLFPSLSLSFFLRRRQIESLGLLCFYLCLAQLRYPYLFSLHSPSRKQCNDALLFFCRWEILCEIIDAQKQRLSSLGLNLSSSAGGSTSVHSSSGSEFSSFYRMHRYVT